jgi:hypothetical protein
MQRAPRTITNSKSWPKLAEDVRLFMWPFLLQTLEKSQVRKIWLLFSEDWSFESNKNQICWFLIIPSLVFLKYELRYSGHLVLFTKSSGFPISKHEVRFALLCPLKSGKTLWHSEANEICASLIHELPSESCKVRTHFAVTLTLLWLSRMLNNLLSSDTYNCKQPNWK